MALFSSTPSTYHNPVIRGFLVSLIKALYCKHRPALTPDVLMVTRADLFPADHGAAVKIIRTAEALSRQGRVVWLTTDNRKTYYRFCDGAMTRRYFPLAIRFFCLPRILAFMRLLLKGFPVSNHFLYLPVTDASYTVRIAWLTSRYPIGAFQAEFPAYVLPCHIVRAEFGGRILLVEHNVEYERIRRQIPGMSQRQFLTLKNLEISMCHLADNIITVSDNDRQQLISDGIDGNKIHTIPHGVDLHAFRETPAMDVRAKYDLPANAGILVYHGTYSYPPNLQAVTVMASEILPRLSRKNISVSVLAIGSKPPSRPLHPAIHFTGSLENVAAVIKGADLAVVSLLEGGGTRMKILDYFAAGVPVISTSKGIEGIGVTNGREAIIADDYDAICDAVGKVLNDGETADRLRTAAGEFVAGLGWDAVVRRYLPLLQ